MIFLSLEYGGPVPLFVQRHLPYIIQDAWKLVGEHWHTHFRPKHFRHAAKREYNYTPRKGEPGSGRAFKGSYTQRKLRRYGHTLPLVLTGESREATRIRDVRVKRIRGSYHSEMNVVMRAPRLNFRHPKSRINMRKELTTVSERERLFLRRMLNRVVHARVAEIRDRAVVDIT